MNIGAAFISFLNGMKALSRKEYFYISMLYFNPPFFNCSSCVHTLRPHFIASTVLQHYKGPRGHHHIMQSQAQSPEFTVALKHLLPPHLASVKSQ